MALRLLEVYLPANAEAELEATLAEFEFLGTWRTQLEGDKMHLHLLLDREKSGAVLDALERRFSDREGFRVVVLAAEASIPRPEPEERKEPAGPRIATVSREELYTDVKEAVNLSSSFVALVALSTIVAAIGLLANNVAVIIGAMVIAPLLPTNAALSLATTLGDVRLARDALRANGIGILLALAIAAAVGLAVGVDPTISEVAIRTRVGLVDIVLALAAGSAAALSITTRLPSAIVGVAVAVALLPPLATLGLLLGSRDWSHASGALLLLLVNLICINLAGVLTFLIQGIQPLRWWEADRAKRATWVAITFWASLLVLLVGVILLSQRA